MKKIMNNKVRGMATIKKRKKVKLTTHQIEKRKHTQEIQSIFTKAGFSRVPNIADKEIEFKGRKGDFDDVFVYQNIIVLVEYTVKSKELGEHLLPKKVLYDLIQGDKQGFIEYLKEHFSSFKEALGNYYGIDHYRVIQIYCSKYHLNKEYKQHLPYLIYLDYPIVKYFQEVVNRIKLSAKYELFNFMRLKTEDIGQNVFSNLSEYCKVAGTVLPESASNFKRGYKVVSFYIAPKELLEKSYVLRQDGWNDSLGVYQRMLVAKKMSSIREYLVHERRVFINNLLVTLPSDTKLIDKSTGQIVDPSKLNKTQPVEIQIPNRYNTIGLIDGQHRVYAYHEDNPNSSSEKIISLLRDQQNMLVSGIIYPDSISTQEKTEFEAKLFLEINSNQANAKTELKQKIGLLLRPFSSESIARSVIMKLNEEGPLLDVFETSFFDKDKVKTTSIVSFGVKSLVKLSGNDSLYCLWANPHKSGLLKGEEIRLLDEYKSFCVKEINEFFLPIKIITSNAGNWTSDRNNPNRVLSTTVINGFIICLRKLIANNKTGNSEFYLKKLSPIATINFEEFKSSQYNKLAEKIYKECFDE